MDDPGAADEIGDYSGFSAYQSEMDSTVEICKIRFVLDPNLIPYIARHLDGSSYSRQITAFYKWIDEPGKSESDVSTHHRPEPIEAIALPSKYAKFNVPPGDGGHILA